MKISACMIVKNEEEMLAKTMPSLARCLDEIILVDTGSSDKTIEVAQGFGARVFRFAWVDDFSAARNESLKHATGDWILWIDADEYLPNEELQKLRAVLETADADAYALAIYEAKPGTCEMLNGYWRVKIFRNGLGYHFVRPINEQLVDAQGKVVVGKEIPVNIYHWGMKLDAIKMDEKRRRYVELYSRALETRPDDPYLHFLLANKLNDLHRLPEALEHYARAYELAQATEIGRQALEKKADVLLRMKDLQAAWAAAEELLKIDPDNIPARSVCASILMVLGKIDLAIGLLKEALQIKSEDKITNLYQTVAFPNFLLGKAYKLKGEEEEARLCFERVRAISPELLGVK